MAEARLRDLEAENAEVKAQMHALLLKMAHMEDGFTTRIANMNAMHVAEMEALTRGLMDESDHLRRERDDLSVEVETQTMRIEELQEKLEGVSETATYVTNMASSLEDIKEANESELEGFKRKAMREKFDIMSQLRDSQAREVELDRRLLELEGEAMGWKERYEETAGLLGELKIENADLRERLAKARERNYSISSLMEDSHPSNGDRPSSPPHLAADLDLTSVNL